MKSLLCLGVASLLVLNCSGSEETSAEATAGTAGSGAVGEGGAAGDGAGTAGSAGASSECSGAGTLDLRLVLPAGVEGDVVVSGPSGYREPVTASVELPDLEGDYSIEAARVKVFPEDERVGYVYVPEVSASTVCVGNEETTSVTVTYTLEPGSHRLWFTAQNGDQLVGAVAGDELEAGGEVVPSVGFGGSASLITHGAVAIDASGNLWVAANDGQITMRPMPTLGENDDAEPSVVLDISAACARVIPCTAGGLAFDADGNLWAGIRDHLLRIDAADLATSGEPEPGVTITGDELDGIEALAFDAEGDLWVASSNDGAILEYRGGRLSADDSEPADVRITALTPSPVIANLSRPSGLAFDQSGNLWVGYWSSNTLARFEPSELAASAQLTPTVQLELSVLALLESIAFDEQGNLWAPGATGEIVGIARDQLTEDGDASVGVTTLSSEAFGSVLELAFYPAPSWSPIAN